MLDLRADRHRRTEISDDMTPDDAFLTINGNMALGTDSWDRDIHRLTRVCTHLRLGLVVRRANASPRFFQILLTPARAGVPLRCFGGVLRLDGLFFIIRIALARRCEEFRGDDLPRA